MVTTSVTLHQARTPLSKLVAKVEAGDEVLVCRGQVPVAKLVPYHSPRAKRPPVGEITSPPIDCQAGCFAALSDDELAAWGMA